MSGFKGYFDFTVRREKGTNLHCTSLPLSGQLLILQGKDFFYIARVMPNTTVIHKIYFHSKVHFSPFFPLLFSHFGR